jgi:hypothetical protein
VAGARYILTAAPSGAWSSFAEHDIVESDGSGSWIRRTPPTDCGWIAFVQDEDANYQFRGSAWVAFAHAASDTLAGLIAIAVQSEMEAASSNTLAVTPGRMKNHPGVAKVHGAFGVAGNLLDGYGISSITDDGTGIATVNFSTDFSSVNYTANVSVVHSGSSRFVMIESKAVGSVQVRARDGSGNLADPTSWTVTVFGDLA